VVIKKEMNMKELLKSPEKKSGFGKVVVKIAVRVLRRILLTLVLGKGRPGARDL